MELHELATSVILPAIGLLARVWLVRVQRRIEVALRQIDDVEAKLVLVHSRADELMSSLDDVARNNRYLTQRMEVLEKVTGSFPAVPDPIEDPNTAPPNAWSPRGDSLAPVRSLTPALGLKDSRDSPPKISRTIDPAYITKMHDPRRPG